MHKISVFLLLFYSQLFSHWVIGVEYMERDSICGKCHVVGGILYLFL